MKNLFKEPGQIKSRSYKVSSKKDALVFDLDNILKNNNVQGKIEDPIPSRRLIILALGIPVVILGIALRLFQLQIIHGNYNLSLADENRIRIETTRAARGIIYDRDKKPLIDNLPSFDLVMIPADLPRNETERNQIFKKVRHSTSVPVKKMNQIIAKKGNGYKDPVLLQENISRKEALILETKFAQLPGIRVEKNPIRRYLNSDLYSHLIGHTGKINEQEYEQNKDEYTPNDYIGKTGLEKSYENILKGKHGKRQVEVDSVGKIAKVISEVEAVAGHNLILTIRTDFEEKMTKALAAGIARAGSQSGVAIALNPQNGEVMGMVSWPNFDNNLFAKGISKKEYTDLSNDPRKPLFNRAINGTYPPGSTIKPLTAAAALEGNVINEWTTVNCKGKIDVENQYNKNIVYRFLCWLHSGHGIVDVKKAIAQSCDVFFYTVSGGFKNFKGLGLEKLRHFFEEFGLGQKTTIDLPNESEGIVPDENWKREVKSEPWYIGDIYHMAIGQGDLLVTPLQLINATAAIANGGTLYKPQLVYQIRDNHDRVIKDFKKQILNQNFISKENLQIVREGMHQTVLSGSARNIGSIGVDIAGKTGTAQYANNQREHAWFTAFAPYENPEIALVVLVEGGGEGHKTAVPIAREILQWYFANKR